jgi:hypothetical protein
MHSISGTDGTGLKGKCIKARESAERLQCNKVPELAVEQSLYNIKTFRNK